ncbi:hypothetical protein F1559_005127 [Cyanidiococcus yangmingshanensis]|uniref:Tubulin-folding cofactor D ARM repeats domain-containing protein n=1 Tax=Cyanidiococcus yangmingshanensis TaxID=2690220 RepID=A0A7J7IR22_9RHOD|nr:hypothetical protein F1559_005127 [Cyanidiococcus yangmingshanensis]
MDANLKETSLTEEFHSSECEIEHWLSTACRNDVKAYTRLGTLLDAHQEDAMALDAVLERLVVVLGDTLLGAFQQGVGAHELVCASSDALYRLCKVRGLSAVCQLLPVERRMADRVFHAILALVGGSSVTDTPWQVAYALLGWGEMAVRVPFPLDERLVLNLTQVGRLWVLSGSAASTAAARFVSRLVTRSDRPTTIDLFRDQLAWLASQTEAQTATGSAHAVQNLGYHLALLLKHAQIQEDVARAVIAGFALLRSGSALLTGRARVKLLKQLGRKLINDPNSRDALSIEACEQLSWVLQRLLETWVSDDTRDRWAAANALAQIGSMLPPGSRDDLLGQLLQIVRQTPSDDEIAGQSACILLAELARVQLIDPGTLLELVHWTLDALCFGQDRPCLRIGASALRDAACYVLWSFSRHLPSGDFADCAPAVAARLLCTALFDREVQCRRAAAAALQECAGRWHDAIPGAMILADRVNFYTVSDRDRAFGELARELSTIAGRYYAPAMRSYLYRYKVFTSPDPMVRLRAAQGLAWLLLADELPHQREATEQPLGSASGASTAGIQSAKEQAGKTIGLTEIYALLQSYVWATETMDVPCTSAAHHGALCTLSALVRLAPKFDAGPFRDLRSWMECPVRVSDQSEAEQIVHARCDLLLALLQTGDERVSSDPMLPEYLLRSLELHAERLTVVARHALLLYFRHNRAHLQEAGSWQRRCLETIQTRRQRAPAVSPRSRSAVTDPVCYAACVMLSVLVATNDDPTSIASLIDALDDCATAKDHASARALVEGLPFLVDALGTRWNDERKQTAAWSILVKMWKASLAFFVSSDRGDGGCRVREAALQALQHLFTSELLDEALVKALFTLLPSILFLCFDRIDRVREAAWSVLRSVSRLSSHMQLVPLLASAPQQWTPETAFAHFAEVLLASDTHPSCVRALTDGFLWAAASPGNRGVATDALRAFATALCVASRQRILDVAQRLNTIWCTPKDERHLSGHLRWPALIVYSALPRISDSVRFLDEQCGATALAVASECAQRSRDGKRLRISATIAIQLTWYPTYRTKTSVAIEMLLRRDYPWLVDQMLEQAHSYGLALLPADHELFAGHHAASGQVTTWFQAFARAIEAPGT